MRESQNFRFEDILDVSAADEHARYTRNLCFVESVLDCLLTEGFFRVSLRQAGSLGVTLCRMI